MIFAVVRSVNAQVHSASMPLDNRRRDCTCQRFPLFCIKFAGKRDFKFTGESRVFPGFCFFDGVP